MQRRASTGGAAAVAAVAGACAPAAQANAPPASAAAPPAPAPPLHYPHTHQRIKDWCKLGLLTDFPGCFQRPVVRRLRSLRGAATMEDADAAYRMRAWYTPPADLTGAGPPVTGAGPRVTRGQRQAYALDAIRQARALVVPAERSPGGPSRAHTGDAVEGLNLLAGNNGA